MSFKKLIPVLAGAALAAGVGCSGMSSSSTPPASELAAQAATTTMPSEMNAENSRNIGALIEPSSKTIKIFNFGQGPQNNAEVWVNNDYIYKVDTIPPGAYITLNESLFFDHSGHALSDTNTTISKVQLHTADKTYTLLGPIVQ